MNETQTTKLRNAVIVRLLSLGADSASKIGAVLNPVSVREAGNRPADPMRYAVMWTLPGRSLSVVGGKMRWQQSFSVDMPVKWSAVAEDVCDRIRLEFASVLSERLPGAIEQDLSEVEVLYPEEGSGYSVVSVTLGFTCIESLTD